MNKTNSSFSSEKLDSELLRTFLAIADTGSFTKGADRIFRSQSAASLQIKQLECVLGQAVFERHARGIVLTALGEKLLPIAQRVVNILDVTVGELKADALKGSIRIGIPDEYGETVLPAVIASFAREHPQVELVVRCSFSANFPEALARNEMDLAVYAAESPTAGAVLLQKEKTLWVSSQNHLVHEQDPLPVALFDRQCWWRDCALAALETSRKRYRVVYTSESVMGVKAAIAAGVAVGVIGESSISAGLKILTPAEGLLSLPESALVLDYHEGESTSVTKAMIEAIMQAFRVGLAHHK